MTGGLFYAVECGNCTSSLAGKEGRGGSVSSYPSCMMQSKYLIFICVLERGAIAIVCIFGIMGVLTVLSLGMLSWVKEIPTVGRLTLQPS